METSGEHLLKTRKQGSPSSGSAKHLSPERLCWAHGIPSVLFVPNIQKLNLVTGESHTPTRQRVEKINSLYFSVRPRPRSKDLRTCLISKSIRLGQLKAICVPQIWSEICEENGYKVSIVIFKENGRQIDCGWNNNGFHWREIPRLGLHDSYLNVTEYLLVRKRMLQYLGAWCLRWLPIMQRKSVDTQSILNVTNCDSMK